MKLLQTKDDEHLCMSNSIQVLMRLWSDAMSISMQ